jgi:threonylcarbamoyladenosine tRNA methylthiotransferase MtaB
VKIYLDSIGCRLNQSEIEAYAIELRRKGHVIQSSPENADLAIINTCAVTNAAVSDSQQKIRQVTKAGSNGIVVTGCWSTLFPDEIPQQPGVLKHFPNKDKDYLINILFPDKSEQFNIEPINRYPISGARFRTRSFLKVQDGCNNQCTYCITTLARGKQRSRPIPEILTYIKNSLLPNPEEITRIQEIVLTGVHLGSWGQDLNPKLHLRDLVQSILDNFDIPRLRLSSLEPWDLDSTFFHLWIDPSLCRHIHLPLQSGCLSTLRRMARRTTPQKFSTLVEQARSAIPDVAITTDIIAGFPGETNAEFEETVRFVRNLSFAGGHVFTYSPRPGTAAIHLPDQVPHPIRKERNAILRQILEDSATEYHSRFIDQTVTVLWESATAMGPDGWQLSGLTDNYIRVHAKAPNYMWNQITRVHITGHNQQGLEGNVDHG